MTTAKTKKTPECGSEKKLKWTRQKDNFRNVAKKARKNLKLFDKRITLLKHGNIDNRHNLGDFVRGYSCIRRFAAVTAHTIRPALFYVKHGSPILPLLFESVQIGHAKSGEDLVIHFVQLKVVPFGTVVKRNPS